MGLDLTEAGSPPLLLRAGTTIARVCAVMLLLPVACHPLGGGVVRFNGELLPRSVVLTRIYPLVLLVGIGTFVVATGLRRGRHWSRPAVGLWFVLWPLLLLLATSGMREPTGLLLLPMLLTVLPVVGGVLAYLYYNPGVVRYFQDVAAGLAKAQARAERSEELEAWLRKPNRPRRGA